MKAKKLISIISAMSMTLSISATLSSVAMAAPAESDVVSVAEVTKGFEFVYDKESSSATKKVVKVNIIGDFAMFAGGFNISFPSDVVTAVTFTQTRTCDYGDDLGGTLKKTEVVKPALGYANFGFHNDALGAVNMRTDKSFGVLEFTTSEDKEFELVSTYQKVEDYDTEVNVIEGIDCTLSNITVPKFESKPVITPITEAGTKVVRHTDGLDTPAEYWVAELDPAGVAFNTIKVVATDKSGATAEDTQTIATLTGDSAISVHVAILNAANEVSKVDVTASYVE